MENFEDKFGGFKEEIEMKLKYPADFAGLNEDEQKRIEQEISIKADEITKRIELSDLSSEEKLKLEEFIQEKY